MINWKVRIKNKSFWLALVPAILILVQLIASLFGFEVDYTELSGKLIAIVNAVFVILAILGIVVDPTTKGISDSDQALLYDEPKESKKG